MPDWMLKCLMDNCSPNFSYSWINWGVYHVDEFQGPGKKKRLNKMEDTGLTVVESCWFILRVFPHTSPICLKVLEAKEERWVLLDRIATLANLNDSHLLLEMMFTKRPWAESNFLLMVRWGWLWCVCNPISLDACMSVTCCSSTHLADSHLLISLFQGLR